jgi:CHASE3 domain sensor protein
LYSRALRLTCGLLALIVIGAAAFLLIRSEQRVVQRTSSLRVFDQSARDVSTALVDARVGQQAYVAAGQGVDFWLGKTTASLQSATTGLTSLRELAGAGAHTAIEQAETTIADFSAIDKRARDYLKSGQQLMAGDVIFTEGSDAAATAVRQIETARQAQHQEADAEAAVTRKEQALTAGAAAGIILLLLLVLIPVPRSRQTAATAGTNLSITPRAPSPGADSPAVSKPVAAPVPAPRPAPAHISHAQGAVLKAATDVVTAFGRVRDLDELTRVLGQAAEVMDASGLMVWVGSTAGDDLRPVLAHGYTEEMIARFPPVPRTADNAAAAAYRSGAMQIVPSRRPGASGAVVAPILTADGCIGALSAEIRSGGETSQSVQALAAIFAAQLAGVLPAAPAEVQGGREATESRVVSR